jgi:hypothetical protein
LSRAKKRLQKEQVKDNLKQKKKGGPLLRMHARCIDDSCLEVKINSKRQSDGESNDDDDEQVNGFTDENQEWLKPKSKKVPIVQREASMQHVSTLVAIRKREQR